MTRELTGRHVFIIAPAAFGAWRAELRAVPGAAFTVDRLFVPEPR